MLRSSYMERRPRCRVLLNVVAYLCGFHPQLESVSFFVLVKLKGGTNEGKEVQL